MMRWDQHRWYDRIVEPLEGHSVAVTVVFSLLNTIGAMGLQSAWESKADVPWRVFVGWLILLLFSVVVVAVTAERTKHVSRRRTTVKVVRKVLAGLAQSCGHPGANARANVMLPTASGHRRRVDAATAFNMESDADRELEVSLTAGVSGQAWQRRTGQIGDLRIRPLIGGPDWGLTASEQARVRPNLQTVLSVPIFDPQDPGGALLGTLQVDSDQDVQMLGWNDGTLQRAQTFSDVIALHLGSPS